MAPGGLRCLPRLGCKCICSWRRACGPLGRPSSKEVTGALKNRNAAETSAPLIGVLTSGDCAKFTFELVNKSRRFLERAASSLRSSQRAFPTAAAARFLYGTMKSDRSSSSSSSLDTTSSPRRPRSIRISFFNLSIFSLKRTNLQPNIWMVSLAVSSCWRNFAFWSRLSVSFERTSSNSDNMALTRARAAALATSASVARRSAASARSSDGASPVEPCASATARSCSKPATRARRSWSSASTSCVAFSKPDATSSK
mmetsp:Transcript_68729/g.223784  ORF Transcript_68729/g.223784 Transcript_68729/m.223784 type:complete len:256 (+) Transcript_68729:1108-1875(+)